MNIQYLDKPKKEKFIEKISNLGVKKIPYLLLRTGKEKIRAYSGSFTGNDISKIGSLLNVEIIGLYIGKEFDTEARLSVDALHLLKEQIKESVLEISEEQKQKWFHGHDLVLDEKQIEECKSKNIKGFVAVKYNEDFLGTGKLSDDKKLVSNFLPKERRIKNKSVI